MRFHKGDRVKLSAEGRTVCQPAAAVRGGVVLQEPRERTETAAVLWDGLKYLQRLHVDFLDAEGRAMSCGEQEL